MSKKSAVTRRDAIKLASAGVMGALGASRLFAEEAPAGDYKIKGNINQSISRWCFDGKPAGPDKKKLTFEDLCVVAKRIGYKSIELLGPGDIPMVKKHGLTCAMLNGAGGIADGWNRKENHDKLEAGIRKAIDCAAENELPNVIVMSGNRKGMSDDEGAENCAIGLKRLVGYAEQKKVTLCMELLNSKVDHKDYMCDHTAWGAALCKKVGSERLKLLYDIYHMEIMESNLVATIKANKDYIGHYHTAGVYATGAPGRNEIDSTQRIDYPAVMRAIVETGFKGFVGQEFVPKRDPIESLQQAFRICDV